LVDSLSLIWKFRLPSFAPALYLLADFHSAIKTLFGAVPVVVYTIEVFPVKSIPKALIAPAYVVPDEIGDHSLFAPALPKVKEPLAFIEQVV
jgi:hypothetical protein